MLFVLIVAVIATIAFTKRSFALGARSGKLASIPFVFLGLFLVVRHLAGLFLSWSTNAGFISVTATNGVALLLDAFLLLVYMTVIRAYWLALNWDSS